MESALYPPGSKQDNQSASIPAARRDIDQKGLLVFGI